MKSIKEIISIVVNKAIIETARDKNRLDDFIQEIMKDENGKEVITYYIENKLITPIEFTKAMMK